MLVEIMPWLGEVLVEWTAVLTCDVMSMGVYTQVSWGLTLPDVLGLIAEDTVAQVYTIFAFAFEVVEDG